MFETRKLHYFEKMSPFPNWQVQGQQLGLLLVIALIGYIATGCTSTSSKQSFEDFGSSGGLSLEKPGNWHADFDERSGTVLLKAERGIFRNDSAHIVIQPFSTIPTSSPLTEHLNAGIEITGIRYNLDAVTITQKPVQVENDKYEIATATILIPTEGIPADSTGNQVGVQESDTFQTVELYAIRCIDNFAMVYVYKGNNEQLNAEAEDIVKSIELNCSTEP